VILFKRLFYKNFLSSGVGGIEIDFTKATSTLFLGPSGSGKSTLLDALSFVLFNKPFRNINKNQLVNAINEREAFVEVEFSIGTTDYKVVRGIKPDVFVIYKDGTPLDSQAAKKDQQTILETQILQTNYKTFLSTVILGAANFMPFMRMKPADRRIVIEEILDVTVFSKMADLAKSRMAQNKEDLKEISHSYEKLSMSLDAKKRELDNLLELKRSQASDLESQLESHNANRITLLASVEKDRSNLKDKQLDYDQNLQKIESEARAHLLSIKEAYDEKVKYLAESRKLRTDELQSHYDKNRQNVEENITKLINDTQVEYATKIKNLEIQFKLDRDHHQDRISKYHSFIEEIQQKIKDCNGQISQHQLTRKAITTDLQHLADKLSFLESHRECPQCQQIIGDEYKDGIGQILKDKTTDANTQIAKIDGQIGVLGDDIITQQKEIESKKLDIQSEQLACDRVTETFNTQKTKLDLERDEIISSFRKSSMDTLKVLESEKDKQIQDIITEEQAGLKVINQTKDTEMQRVQDAVASNQNNILSPKKKEIEELKTKLTKTETELAFIDNQIRDLQNEQAKITKMDNIIDTVRTDFSEMEQSSLKINESRQKLLNMAIVLEKTMMILKDSGIKSRVIAEYMPLVNKYINHFLDAMGFYVNFTLDESYEETIRMAGRETLSYENFSEGERQRMDLALLFTWRHIAQTKNSVHTNLLIMDEILDSYLDLETTENVLVLLKDSMFNRSNIFVISHKTSIADHFERVVNFTTNKNFAQIY
jgi:DNA repair exonuclease SbcCD ATPase subunit